MLAQLYIFLLDFNQKLKEELLQRPYGRHSCRINIYNANRTIAYVVDCCLVLTVV